MMNDFVAKQDGESIDEYTARLCANKSVYGLKWDTIATLVNKEAGTNYTGDKYRKQFSKSQNEDDLNLITLPDEAEELTPDELLYELNKLKVQARDERTAAAAMFRRMAREDTIKELGIEAARALSSKKLLPSVDTHKNKTKEKYAVLNIGDWHYGLVVDNYWNTFDTDVCKKRVASLTRQTIEKCEANNITHLVVNGLGDYINGVIHLPLRVYSQEDVMTQIMTVSEMLAEMLAELSLHFFVTFYNVLGNHARVTADKKESIDLESLERIVPWYLTTRLAGNKNVVIEDNEYDIDFTLFTCNGWKFAAVHGDKDKVNSVARNIAMMVEDQDCIITAHKHHLSADEQNRCIVISNPSLIGVDDYSKNLRLTSRPAQTLIIVGDSAPVECLYYINLE